DLGARAGGVLVDVVVDPVTEDLAAAVDKHTSGAGADVAFDAAGVQVVVNQLLGVLGAGGRLEVVALHMKPVELDLLGQLTMQDRSPGNSICYARAHDE